MTTEGIKAEHLKMIGYAGEIESPLRSTNDHTKVTMRAILDELEDLSRYTEPNHIIEYRMKEIQKELDNG